MNLVVHWSVQICIEYQQLKIYIHFKAMQVCLFFVNFFYSKIQWFLFYLVISSITPNSGSTAGGTTLTITGNFFDTSATYPLVVNVAGQPCTILSVTTTTIQCQTPIAPSGSQNQYQGTIDIEHNIFVKLNLLFRWSRFTIVSYIRFYCTSINSN